MVEQIEISSLDLTYQGCRLKSNFTENKLLSSIRKIGIQEPLQGVNSNGRRILLDGFKRYRCAKSLKIEIIPYSSLSDEEANGVIELLRTSNVKSLSILEQAKLIDHLINVQKMANSEIADQLEKSKAWVSVRTSIVKEMSDFVLSEILEGRFPAYAYMYNIRQFMRINKIARTEIDEFVSLVSGKNLSIRDIEILVCGYFNGNDDFRTQMKEGNIMWGLERIKENAEKTAGCSELEQTALRELESVLRYMRRIIFKIQDKRLSSSSFLALANITSKDIVDSSGEFLRKIGDFYEKSARA
ncbi:MAG: chromosome partitioning protein ParB [Candidatus Riflebacteria bacterium]|nr:chromosome partitioning protein ParB [Candidatus Riflebacteria bacterium]